MLIVPGTVQ